MATSIITTTTFTFATIIDVGAPVASISIPVPAVREPAELEITPCLLADLPRCNWTARKRCGHKSSCRS